MPLFSYLWFLAFIMGCSGCALHYYDERTGSEHIFGLGYMVMKVSAPKNEHQAIVTGTDIVGLGIGLNEDGGYLTVGWDVRRRIEIIDENASVDLAWPDSNFLNTRVGSSWLRNESLEQKAEESDHE